MAALSFPSDNQTGSRDSFLSDSEKAAGISPVAFYAVGECIGMSVRPQTSGSLTVQILFGICRGIRQIRELSKRVTREKDRFER